jgi:flavin reductase (DIM6/NTAB) family NADH-FMN oxidoreductase RutF
MTMIDADAFKLGMRQLAAGVSIVTTRRGEGRAGLTATAVCSVSAEPPQLLVCVHQDSDTYEAIRESGVLCVNLLDMRHEGLARCFAGMTGKRGDERFTEGHWGEMLTGAPRLLDALAAFDCRIRDILHSGSHCIFVARVVEVAAQPGGEPLLYMDGQFAGLEV